MSKYRVFTNDVAQNRYSAFCDVDAGTLEAAKVKALAKVNHACRVLVLSHYAKNLWPKGRTGEIDTDLLRDNGNFARFQ